MQSSYKHIYQHGHNQSCHWALSDWTSWRKQNKYSFWSIVRISSAAERGESAIISNQEPKVEYCGTVCGRENLQLTVQRVRTKSVEFGLNILRHQLCHFSTNYTNSKFHYSNLEIWAIAPEVRTTRSLACHVSRNVANNHFSPWGFLKTEMKPYDQHSRLMWITDGEQVWWELHRGDVLPVTQTQYCKKYRWSLQTFFLWRHEKNLYCDTIICVLCH